MSKPSKMMVATAVFGAGIGNAFIYALGFLALVLIQFITKGGGGATVTSAVTSFIVTLMVSLLLSCIITFVLAFPIALVCRRFGLMGTRSFVIAPAIGAVITCAIASLLGVAVTTYVAIVAFSYITAAWIWLGLGRSNAVPQQSTANRQPA